MAAHPHTVVLGTDARNLRPCCYTTYSILKNARGPIQIYLLSIGVEEEDAAPLNHIVSQFKGATFTHHAVHPSKLDGGQQRMKHITKAAYLRLLIPNFFNQRVVYLDSDVMVRKNICTLWDFDLGPNPVGAVVNTAHLAMKYYVKNGRGDIKKKQESVQKDLAIQAARVGFDDPERYLNSGVLVIDCPALKADEDLCAKFTNIKAAGSKRFIMDNDWLIHILHNKVTWLPPGWNCVRGNVEMTRRYIPQRIKDYYAPSCKDPAIVHFTGINKPWDTEHTAGYLVNNPFTEEYRTLMHDCDALLATPLI
ncbi:MAG: glycosyltransferase family 8 protein [Planktomarina sp.]